MKWTDSIPLAIRDRLAVYRQNGHMQGDHESRMGRKSNGKHPPAARVGEPKRGTDAITAEIEVSFPDDGKKRVLITIAPDGAFEPIRWFNMNVLGPDQGLHEASVIVAHAGFMMCEQELYFFAQAVTAATEAADARAE